MSLTWESGHAVQAAGVADPFLEKNDVYGEDTANPGHINHPTDPVYIIYTSGTGGRPKGTMIEHRSLMNHSTWHSRYYEITGADHSTQYAGFGFDASVLEIFPYLTRGAALHIIHDALKLDILALKDYYVKHNITITFCRYSCSVYCNSSMPCRFCNN